MKNQTFQHIRIVQLSKQLDQQRQKNIKLAKENRELYEKIKQIDNSNQSTKNHVIDLESHVQKMKDQLQKEIRQSNKVKEEKALAITKAEQIQLENVRQRQKIQEFKEQMTKFELKMKNLLFDKEKQIATHQKQNSKLREQNIELQKLYLKKRQQFQKKEEKTLKSLTKTLKDIQNFRKDLQNFQQNTISQIDLLKKSNNLDKESIYNQIAKLQNNIQKQANLKKQIYQLQSRLEEVISENSQKIIQLYKCKNLI